MDLDGVPWLGCSLRGEDCRDRLIKSPGIGIVSKGRRRDMELPLSRGGGSKKPEDRDAAEEYFEGEHEMRRGPKCGAH